MPRYFLHHVVCENRAEDPEGYLFEDASAAEWEAVLSIRMIVGERLIAGGAIPDGHVEIVDEDGAVVSIITHHAALRAP